MTSKGDVVGLVSERACRLSDKPLLADPVCLSLSVNIVAVWHEGRSLIVFFTVVCKQLGGERRLDCLSMRELPCWKEWFPVFFSGVLHFFKSQTV